MAGDYNYICEGSMYTIGRLARKTRVKVDSIRFYERQGLVAPETKTAAGYRLYTDAAVRRLTLIKHAQRCGFTLAEIGKLLSLYDSTGALQPACLRMLADKKREIDKTVEALRAMSQALATLLSAANRPHDESASICPEHLLLSTLATRV